MMELDLNRLKRFDKSKHEQLEGLLQWCQLMGLSGRDLVSLGGHIARAQEAENAKKNRAIAEGYKCDKVGNDSSVDSRFSLTTVNGRYAFYEHSYNSVEVLSYKTKIRKVLTTGHWDLGKIHWTKSWRYRALLAVHAGDIVLDF